MKKREQHMEPSPGNSLQKKEDIMEKNEGRQIMTGMKKTAAGRKATGRYLIFGLIIGILLAGLIGWKAMPGMMLTTHESRYDTVEETCVRLKAAIEENGWSCPAVRDMNMTMEKHGVTMDRSVKIVELCKAQYANEVLTTNPEVSTLMPCAWGVYEGDDGRVYITGMNMGLMGKMFGGNIAKVMGGSVSKDEAQMLARVVKE
jgi:uncharacterized protein (DUF302 family)